MSEVGYDSFRKSIQSTLEAATFQFVGSDTSEIFDAGGSSIIGFLPDGDISGTSVSPLYSIDGETFVPCITGLGGDVSFSVKPNKITLLATTDLLAFRYIKLKSTTTETCTIQAITRRVA